MGIGQASLDQGGEEKSEESTVIASRGRHRHRLSPTCADTVLDLATEGKKSRANTNTVYERTGRPVARTAPPTERGI